MKFKNIELHGKPCSSPEDAVAKFKASACKGICDAGCPLHGLHEVRPGGMAHMCDDLFIKSYPEKVLQAIGCDFACRRTPDENKLYAAVIKTWAVRGATYCDNTGGWRSMPGASLWLGFFRGPNALQKAAGYAGTDAKNIQLIPVDNNIKAR